MIKFNVYLLLEYCDERSTGKHKTWYRENVDDGNNRFKEILYSILYVFKGLKFSFENHWKSFNQEKMVIEVKDFERVKNNFKHSARIIYDEILYLQF